MTGVEILTHVQYEQIMKRFPAFELSYETISHKKVSSSYNTCFAIPQGKKCFAWFTFLGEEDVCFVFDLNREKKIVKTYRYPVNFAQPLALGTVFYGTFLEEERPFFVIEDIFYYKGINLKNTNIYQKLDFTKDALEQIKPESSALYFALPVFWDSVQSSEFVPDSIIPPNQINNIGYTVHHLQYRSLYETVPFINVQLSRPGLMNVPVPAKKLTDVQISSVTPDYSKPQFNYPTAFQVRADLQFDVYHLYAYGQTGEPVYYGLAGIPNYKTSVFMNSLFRKIRENLNLDFIEESDDEEDFQNGAEDKYVDLEKKLVMECTFHKRFKKWIPLRVVDARTRLIHVGKLARDAHSRPQLQYKQQQYRRPQYQPNGGYQNKKYRPTI